MDERKHGWKSNSKDKNKFRICFTFVGWSQNKTGQKKKKKENHTAVKEKQVPTEQCFTVTKTLQLICKNDEGRMKSTFKKHTNDVT